MKKFPFAAGRTITAVNEWIIVVSSMVVVTIIFSEIVARYVFAFSITGYAAIGCGAGIWLWFAGMAFATRTDSHVGGRFPVKSESFQRKIKLTDLSMSLFVTLVFTYFAVKFCLFNIKIGITDASLHFPMIYVRAAVPLGLILTAAYIANNLVGRMRSS